MLTATVGKIQKKFIQIQLPEEKVLHGEKISCIYTFRERNS